MLLNLLLATLIMFIQSRQKKNLSKRLHAIRMRLIYMRLPHSSFRNRTDFNVFDSHDQNIQINKTA